MSTPAAFHVVDAQKTREFLRIVDGSYRLTLLREGLQFDVTRLRWERGELFGLLTVACDIAGAKTVDGILSVGTFNLTSVSARSSRARELSARALAPEIDFGTLLEELCQRTLKAEQAGQPVLLLRDVTPVPTDQSVITVYGLPIPLRHPIIWFSHGGGGKTTLSQTVAGELERQGITTLVLDWELNEYEHRATLERQFGADMPAVKYRRCERPLVVEVDGIAQQITECGIDYVVCDSAGYASDGRPEDAEVALRYFRALRQLRVGSLTLAHISSGEHGTEKPFGSVFWHNSARATWYLERDTSISIPDEITIALFNRKNNLGRLLPPVGLSLQFTPTRTIITPTNLAEHAELATKIPLSQRMRHALHRGPKTLGALAEELDGDVETLDRYVRRSPKYYTRVTSDDGITRIALVERRSA